MKKSKRVLAFLLAVLLCVSMLTVLCFADDETAEGAEEEATVITRVDPDAFESSAGQTVPASYTKVSENANMALYLDYATGRFAVLNKKDATAWFSNPLDSANDKVSNSETASIAVSQLQVTFVTATFKTESLYSDGNAKVITETYGDSQIITYFFDSADLYFSIPLMLTLKEDYLEIELLVDSIKEMSDTRILTVALLPAFGAGNPKDTGYIFLPDGTGSLMNFNEYYNGLSSYSGSVYKSDPTITASVSEWNYGRDLTEDICLPVYGVRKNNSAYFSVMTQSEANVTLKAYNAGMINSYNFIYPSINIRDSQKRRTSTGNTGTGVYYSDELPENFIMRIYLLSGNDADYIGMAKTYRKYLVNEIGLKALSSDVGTPMNITLIGAYRKTKHFLGFPYTGVNSMTTFSEASDIITSLSESGVDNLICGMMGWSGGGLEGSASTTFSPESVLGGKKAAKELLQKADELNVPLMFDVDIVNFYSGSGKYKKYNSTVYGLDLAPVSVFPFVVSQNRTDPKQTPHFLFHPTSMLSMASTFVANASGDGVKNFSFNTAGSEPYAAYNTEDTLTRDKSATKINETFKTIADATDGIVSTSSGTAFTLPSVNNFIEAPLYSSQMYFASTEVPFYYMALRGLVRLSGPALNLSAEPKDLILRSAQYGVGLYAVLSHESSSNLKDTGYNKYYSTEYALLSEDIITAYKRLSVVYKAVGVSTITGYEQISDSLKITTFENGAKVYVNYGEKEVTHNGVKVPARDFTVVGGDK